MLKTFGKEPEAKELCNIRGNQVQDVTFTKSKM